MEIRSMFQPIVTRSLQYTHDRDRVRLPVEPPCECPKSPASRAARRAISGIPVFHSGSPRERPFSGRRMRVHPVNRP
ncbi:hypothetical protein DF157_07270 [Burkholderia cenocepacia]|nr:hypothetical protein DF157_07270 [Burkholderia cenocepacia]RQV38870.1 hypothetical protein DF028_18085 [Burkholderia cenocepacia]RQV48201.1 hypothetical protein DF027_07225 [Burkholderia cenocepacia]RQV80416.1 hypothetical protein DF010_07750 [Burkholderia cenocepacia]